MKRLCSFSIAVLLILSSIACACNRKGISRVTIVPMIQEEQEIKFHWEEPEIKPCVNPYTVERDLSNISNMSTSFKLNPYDKYMLYKNSFVVKKPEKALNELFNIYEENESDGIPSFITTDNMVHIYNMLCAYIIRIMEKERLINELKEFTEGSFHKSLEVYNGTNETTVKKAALKNIAYFGIAMKLLNMSLPGGIPLEANRIIDNDVKKVRSRWSSGTSDIFPYHIDYSRYAAKGHYSRDSELKNYFLAMMWYGNTPMVFETRKDKDGTSARLDEQILMAILMTAQTLEDENLRVLWNDIYSISAEYFGNTHCLNLYDLSSIINAVYGEKIDFNKMWNEDKIEKVYEQCKNIYCRRVENTISGKLESFSKGNSIQVEFRLMNSIYNLEDHIYNTICTIENYEHGDSRGFASGLNVEAAAGNPMAQSLLNNLAQDNKNSHAQLEKLNGLMEILSMSVLAPDPNNFSINNSMYWILKGPERENNWGCPAFMASEEWEAKKLISSLAGAVDARYPEIISVKNNREKEENFKPGDEMPGYVEPDVNLYGRLEYMAKYMKEFLSIKNFTDSGAYRALDDFIDSVVFLKDMSVKELSNVPFTEDEARRLKNFGRELKLLILNVADSKKSEGSFELNFEPDKNMASVKNACEYDEWVLQAATGLPDYIYVVVPYKDKLYLTRGSIFSYYEFVNSPAKKLDNNEWRRIAAEGKEVKQPVWLKSIKGRIGSSQ